MDEELYHYGVKGMKWGIRRSPAQLGHKTGTKKKKKSGTLAKAGKKVAESAKKAYSDHRERKRVKKLMKKKPSKMTNEELNEYINRMNLERAAKQARQSVKQISPDHVNAGVRFMKAAGRDVVAPAVKNVGRQYLEKVLRDAAGLSDKKSDPLAQLRAETERLQLQNKKETLTDQIQKRADEKEREKRYANAKHVKR